TIWVTSLGFCAAELLPPHPRFYSMFSGVTNWSTSAQPSRIRSRVDNSGVLVPADQVPLWASTPLSGLAHHLNLPALVNGLVILLVLVAAFLMLVPSAHAALEDTEQLLRRLSARGALPEELAPRAPSGGSTTGSLNAAAAA